MHCFIVKWANNDDSDDAKIRATAKAKAATTNPIYYVFILAINIWKMRNTEYMHFNLITLTCIAHLIQQMGYQNIKMQLTFSGQFILVAPNGAIFIYSYFLAVFFVGVRTCKWWNDILPQDVLAIDIREPFFYLKNENWHKLMATFKVCGAATLYITCYVYLHEQYVFCAGASGFWLLWQSGNMYANDMRHGRPFAYIVRWWPYIHGTLEESITEDEN